MKQYRTEIVIQRSPEVVWAALIDFDSYPRLESVGRLAQR